MPLILALKNRQAIVVATDTTGQPDSGDRFGQLISLPNRSVMLLAGNLEAVRDTVMTTILPKVTTNLSAAGLAQLLSAALVLEVVPHLPQISGRIEIIVAGIDPLRHTEQPGLYYLDSARDFYLQMAPGDAVAAGTTAEAAGMLQAQDFALASVEQLQTIAKDCLGTTKLRWPTALGGHLRLGVITAQNSRFEDF